MLLQITIFIKENNSFKEKGEKTISKSGKVTTGLNM